jgi:secretion/DNA translocation related TadE-like protein
VTARRGEAGAATLLVVALAGVLLLVGAALAVVGAMVAAHRQAQAAADLTALAGATAAARGGDACQYARVVARLNDATVVACAVDGSVVTVQVRVTGPHWLGQTADLEARARAGPDRASPIRRTSREGIDEE